MYRLPSLGAENRQRVFWLVLAALIALCWVDLAIWSLSPYAPYLGHEILEHTPFGGTYLLLLFVFVLGWLLMSAAMMLPTSLPLVAMFLRMTRRRPGRLKLAWLLVAGYLCVWTLFGGLAHLGDLMIHATVHRVGWLEANTWTISALTLLAAGLYQFSPVKYACLDKCRSPLSFISTHWRGRHERRESLMLGAHHGIYCLGCCWSLMLLMFLVGMANLGWMLLLGAAMAVEKNLSWGKRISAPLGVLLIALSGAVVAGSVL